MISGACAAAHSSCYQDTVDIRLIAQIFKSLRISFTYYLCIRIFVKNPYHLPGISISSTRCKCSIIVRYIFTDIVFVCCQFVPGARVTVSVHDCICVRHCRLDRVRLLRINNVGLISKFLGHSHRKCDATCKSDITAVSAIFRSTRCGCSCPCLIVPIHIIGKISQKSIVNKIKIKADFFTDGFLGFLGENILSRRIIPLQNC